MNDCCNRPGRDGYDVAVVGAGSAGFSAAITAAELGAKVALIGHGTIGGTCAALYVRNGTVSLDGCDFFDNDADLHGGAVGVDDGHLIVRSCRFVSNQASR